MTLDPPSFADDPFCNKCVVLKRVTPLFLAPVRGVGEQPDKYKVHTQPHIKTYSQEEGWGRKRKKDKCKHKKRSIKYISFFVTLALTELGGTNSLWWSDASFFFGKMNIKKAGSDIFALMFEYQSLLNICLCDIFLVLLLRC